MQASVTIAVFTATCWESRAVRQALSPLHISPSSSKQYVGQSGHHRVIVIQTGIGPVKARQACRQVCMAEPVDLLVASGFIGALQPADIGSLVVAQSVEASHPWPSSVPFVDRLSCHPDFVQRAVRLGRDLDIPVLDGSVLTVGHVVASAREKRELARKTGAIGVDMESAAIGQVAREQGRPFLVVRAITDRIDDDLPVEFNLFRSRAGWVRGMAMLMSPRRIAALYRLKHSADRASCTLTRFFAAFLASVDPGALPERKRVSRD